MSHMQIMKRISVLSLKLGYPCSSNYLTVNPLRLLNTGKCARSAELEVNDPHVPKSSEEVKDLLKHVPDSPINSKVLKIAIIGVPNSGKSTLINQLVKWKVCSVSRKVHTTVCNARALANEGDSQLIFLDTPGIVTAEEIKRHKLTTTCITDPESSLAQADCIGVLHDISNSYTRHYLPKSVLRLLSLYPTIPSILIMNKVDLVDNKSHMLTLIGRLTNGRLRNSDLPKPKQIQQISRADLAAKLLTETKHTIAKKEIEPSYNILQTTDDSPYKDDPVDLNFTINDVLEGKIQLTENQVAHFIKDLKYWPKFNEVFMTSALDGLGVDGLRHYFFKSALPGPWLFNEDVLTDQAPQDMALMTVREKFLEHLTRNVPYEFKFKVIYWDLSEADVLNMIVSVSTKKKNLYKYLLEKSGTKLRRIAREAEQELRNTFRTEVRLRLNVENSVAPLDSNKRK